MSTEIQYNGNTINSIDDLILGKNQTIQLTRLSTEQVNVSHTFASNGERMKAAQTITDLTLSYSAGYSINIELIGGFMLNDTNNSEIFTDVAVLSAAMKERDFKFDPFGCYLGVETNEAVAVTPHDAQQKIAGEIDSLASELDGFFAARLTQELVGAINSKEFSLATEILDKSKLSAIELIESKLR